jgi:hypothetical protein
LLNIYKREDTTVKIRQFLTLLEQQKDPTGTPETGIEYYTNAILGYDKDGDPEIEVALSQMSLLKVTKMSLREFWNKRDDKKLVEQFIKATLGIAKKYGINSKYTYESYHKAVKELFQKHNDKLDILFELEPGYNFKGLFKDDKFSIHKIRHDKGEAETGAWARKEREELSKLK